MSARVSWDDVQREMDRACPQAGTGRAWSAPADAHELVWMRERVQLADVCEVDPWSKRDVARYAKRSPATQPPVMLIEHASGCLFPEDGAHRVAASRLRGDRTIDAFVGRRIGLVENPRFSRAGVAWKPETPVFHATTALQQVLRGGFKTRRALEAEQGVRAQAAGGQHDLSVSFTTDARVAGSICVCLEVVGQLSRRSLQLSKLAWLAQQQLPKAYRSLMMAADFASYIEHADEIDRGWVRRWDGSAYSWGPPRAGEGSEQHKAQYAEYAIEVYTRLLATADQFHEAHNPILFTDPEFASKWDLDNFGIVEARLGLEWVIARPDALVAAGALDRSLLVPFVQDRVQGWVGDAVRELRGRIEGAQPDEIYRAQHPLVDRYGRVVVGEGAGVEIVSDVEIDPKTTGEYARGEAEVRVYDPAVIRDVKLVATLDDVLAKVGEDRIAYPYFDQYVQPDLS